MKKLLLLAASLVLVAACGGPGATTTVRPTTTAAGTPTAGATTPAASPTAAATSPAASGSPAGSPSGETVTLAQTSLGMVLVGSNGKTLYGFTPDLDAGKPTCNGECAAVWPPLTVTGEFTVGEGLDDSMFAAVARDDGTQQLAIGDYPLYFYAPDINPGDVTGQNVGGKWFVVGADGELIMTAP